ncbi:hypothetical protein BN1723_003502 [Verticillium longisporum]|uniref:Uncharacterized protein n=1 Tax=Verticillium longisporum TaxID=100787 RepID=A0A0G4LZB2_VERLO|nr:hypothetical protein BN1723_003502 [Verticillium longisporum]
MNTIDQILRPTAAAADDDGTDQIGYDTPRSGVATPQPDLSDKRLPGIMSYFGQRAMRVLQSPCLIALPVSVKKRNRLVTTRLQASVSIRPRTFVDESHLDDQMRGNRYDDEEMDDAHGSHRGQEDDDWDDLGDVATQRGNRMSGIEHAGKRDDGKDSHDDQMIGNSQFDD